MNRIASGILRLCGLVLAAGLWCPWGAAHAGLRLELDSDGLSAQQVAATQSLLDDALTRLPPSLLAQTDQTLTVRWSDRLPHATTGRARSRALLLNRRLLPLLEAELAASSDEVDASQNRVAYGANPAQQTPHPSAAGRSARTEIMATLLHEVAHFHDRHTGLSADPRLLDLAGWQVKVKRPRARASENPFVDRTPDPYELTSPREFLAVNLEHFLLDPEYACRRPALHRYFSAHFGWAPPHEDCSPGFTYLAVDADGDIAGDGAALATLDPARVTSIEYLLAEGNSEPMSRWGHSMLRLVVCAPGRPPGPDCRLDLHHHVVLSFRAFVDDVQLSSWRGLTGSYPSRLFVLPLAQVVDEYTRDQLRGLQSIPLQLERDEIAALLERAARLHWSYDGRYYFISNNCAVETFKLLHDGVPRLAQSRIDAITPTGLLRKLERADIADAGVLEDAAEARRLGYRFDSLRERYQAMFEIARGELALPQTRVEDWFTLGASARRAHFDDAGTRATAALLLLEESARRRQLVLARQELKRRFLGSRSDPEVGAFADVDATLQQILVDSGFLSRPATLFAGEPGYGLPQPAEIDALQTDAAARTRRLAALGNQLTSGVEALLDTAVRDELAATAENLQSLRTQMGRLNREAGGLELR
ncbi:DUF7844 domain-containing protein [Novilysobacter ciconiae]|uniref:DUF7844 domain-containing protein n=1 Tax=Novilysobacter ciconiae TaxID=2781022 RepID=UPI001D16A673|nr:DUF4105 domain-containing protein [Lysobacter ciconiae]